MTKSTTTNPSPPPSKAKGPPPTAKPSPTSKAGAALAVLTSTYVERSTAALASLREREAEIGTRLSALVSGFVESLTAPDSDDAAALRELLGENRIVTYVRAESASRALAVIAEAEGGEPVVVAPKVARPVATIPEATSTTAKATSTKAKPTVTRATPPTTAAEPGAVLLSGPAKWNYYALVKASKSAAQSAGWTPARLGKFIESVTSVRKHSEVLDLAKKAGLRIVT